MILDGLFKITSDNMDKILVVGCSGLVGGRLMELAACRYELFGTYNEHEIQGKNIYKLDATDRKNTFRLVEKIKPDCVVDVHSLTNLDYCETHPEETWHTNVVGSRNIAEACKNFGCKYIFLSTDYVFDGRKTKKYSEKDKPHPLCYYSKTKAITEYVLTMLDVDHLTIRSSVIYGKGSNSARVNFVLWLISKLKKNESVRVVDDQRSCPTFADNLIEFILALYEKDETGLFHVTGKDCINRYDFSCEVANLFGFDRSLISQIRTAELHQTAQRPSSVDMSVDKAEKAAKMQTLGIKEGLSILKKQIGDRI